VARGLLEEWELAADGDPVPGAAALVLPVTTSAGRPALLKVGTPGRRAEHEALALQRWGGRGAARLLRADPHRGALLLERLHAEDLTMGWDVEACEVVGGLYRSLHVPAPPQLRRLSEAAAGWAEELATVRRSDPVPHRLVEQARSLARSFAADPATDGVLLHTDLHFAHVLAADRAPWLAVAPRPLSGDPHFEVAPMLWHRTDEYAGRVRDGVRDRFFALVDTAELEEERARDWVVVRTLVEVRRAVAVGATPDRARLTTLLSIAKAVQG
jgi:streptomycin 6-kinase